MRNDQARRLGESASIPVANQLSQTIRMGLPLESGLRALAAQTRSPRTKHALEQICRTLEQGTPLAKALRDSESSLPRSMSALVEAGLESGRLDCLMQYSVEQTRYLISLRQQIWLSLSYPLFLAWLSAVICGATLLLIPLQFRGIFDDFGMELPYLTVALISVSSVMNAIGWMIWLLLAGILAASLLGLMVFGASNAGQRWTTSIPLIGRVFQYAALADLCRLLALLAESGLPLPRALRFTGEASEDYWLMRKVQNVADEIEIGTSPWNAATIARLPNSLAQVFRNSNSKQIFIEALRGLADIYSARCFNSSQLINSVVRRWRWHL